jgi:hypothetical protein
MKKILVLLVILVVLVVAYVINNPEVGNSWI